MTVVLVVSAISSRLNIVVNRSVVLIFLLLLAIAVVVRFVNMLLAISMVEVLLAISKVEVLLAIRGVFETKFVLSESAANEALETTDAIT